MATETLRPNGAGSETSIDKQYPNTGSHWDKVDEASADGNSTYVENKGGPAGGWQRDLYALPASSGSGAIDSIAVHVRTKHNVSRVKVSLRTGGITYDSADFGWAVWTTAIVVWTTNPNTGVAWEWADIDALEIGVNLKGSTASPDWSRCTQVYVVVTYIELVAATITTGEMSYMGKTRAIAHGNITSLGIPNPTEHGHCWALTSDPTTADGKTTKGVALYTGWFLSLFGGLTRGNTYYTRAYVTNNAGTSYGENVSWVAEEEDQRYFWVEGVGWHFFADNKTEKILTDTATHASLGTGTHGLDSLKILKFIMD